MSCMTFFAPLTVTKYCGDPSDPLLHILLWCCATAATPLWLMLWCWCCAVAAAVYRVITLPAMPGHAPADRWTYTQLWRMSQQSQHQTRSSCYILCMPGIRMYLCDEDVRRLSDTALSLRHPLNVSPAWERSHSFPLHHNFQWPKN